MDACWLSGLKVWDFDAGILLIEESGVKINKDLVFSDCIVASNKYIRNELQKLCLENDAVFFAPPIELCTDNGAMIAWAGYEKYNYEGSTKLDFKPRPRWPLDPEAHLKNPIQTVVGKGGVKA